MIAPLSHRRGYVLVVTLGLLAMASTLLVTIGRTAVHHALLAHQAQDQLQRQWGVASCRSAVLPYAQSILARQEQATAKPMPAFETSIVLGRQTFAIVVFDEQAKANINAMLEQADTKTVESRLRAAMVGSGVGPAVHLRSEIATATTVATMSETSSSAAPPIRRWISAPGQIFDDLPPARLFGTTGAAPMNHLTCWGNGAVNLLRVSESTLQIAATPQLSPLQVSRLIATRDAMFADTNRRRFIATRADSAVPPGAAAQLDPVAQLLAQAGIDPKIRLAIAMSSTSSCYSVWVTARNERRSWYNLTVSDEADPLHPRTQTLTW